jgi:hypothetical protein
MSQRPRHWRIRAGQSRRRAACSSAGVLGLLGSVACAVSMLLVAAGVADSAAATSMAAMTGTGTPGGALGGLVRIGPWLMLASVLLVTAAFALTRRPVTAVPALLAGAVLYTGMYAQASLAVMYASIAVGYTAWAALLLRVRAGGRRPWTSDHSGTCPDRDTRQASPRGGTEPCGR